MKTWQVIDGSLSELRTKACSSFGNL